MSYGWVDITIDDNGCNRIQNQRFRTVARVRSRSRRRHPTQNGAPSPFSRPQCLTQLLKVADDNRLVSNWNAGGRRKKHEGLGALASRPALSRRRHPTQNGAPSSFNRPKCLTQLLKVADDNRLVYNWKADGKRKKDEGLGVFKVCGPYSKRTGNTRFMISTFRFPPFEQHFFLFPVTHVKCDSVCVPFLDRIQFQAWFQVNMQFS
jgi:hypothetical protein